MSGLPKIVRVNHCKAATAFAAHSALLKAERANPELLDNPIWTMLRQDAFEAFANAFEVEE